MKVDVRHDVLFVAGGGTGQAYIYDVGSGEAVATYQLAAPATSFINDVTLTSRARGSRTPRPESSTSCRWAATANPAPRAP